jgi:small neutral amino acid transporter SnatA (MarC family)
MHTAALVAVLAFIVLFASLTISVIAKSGLDVLTVISLFFLVVIAVPVVGGLFRPPPDDE